MGIPSKIQRKKDERRARLQASLRSIIRSGGALPALRRRARSHGGRKQWGFRGGGTSKKLDQYYISTRYPKGLPGGIPSQFYDDPDEAKAAMKLAKSVMDLVTEKVPLS
jgi:HEPN domain-containing protein